LAGKRFVSTHVAARRLGCSPSTIRRWIDEGILPAVQAGRGKQYHIRESDLDDLIDRDALAPQ